MLTDLDSPPNSNESANSQQEQGNAKKIGLLALLAVVTLAGYWLLGDRLSFEYLATAGDQTRHGCSENSHCNTIGGVHVKALRRKEEKAVVGPTLCELRAFAY